MTSAPWTEIGRLQSDIQTIRQELYQYAKSYQIDEISRRLDSLEHSLREIGSKTDDFLYRQQATEDRLTRLGMQNELD